MGDLTYDSSTNHQHKKAEISFQDSELRYV